MLPEASQDSHGTVTQSHATDKEEDIKSKKEEKKKKSVREDTHTLFTRIVGEYTFTKEMRAKLGEWITYKVERKEGYKETGLKSLLRQVETKCAEFGEPAVMELIDLCMARSWKGIIFDQLGKVQPVTQRPVYQKPTKADEMNDFYNMAAGWAAEGE
jgi:hypothetical protein